MQALSEDELNKRRQVIAVFDKKLDIDGENQPPYFEHPLDDLFMPEVYAKLKGIDIQTIDDLRLYQHAELEYLNYNFSAFGGILFDAYQRYDNDVEINDEKLDNIRERLSSARYYFKDIYPDWAAQKVSFNLLTSRQQKVFLVERDLGIDQENSLPHFNFPVEFFEMTVRLMNVLERIKVKKLGDLRYWTLEELGSLRNFGQKSAEELQSILDECGGLVFDDYNNVDTVKKKISTAKIFFYHTYSKQTHQTTTSSILEPSEELINKKIKEFVGTNTEQFLKPLRDFNENSVLYKHKDKFDIVAQLAEPSDEDLEKAGVPQSDFEPLNVELVALGLRRNLRSAAIEYLKENGTEIAAEAEKMRIEKAQAVYKEKYNL